jgi:predicted TIM-barrel fold metal-dependent hydrolase
MPDLREPATPLAVTDTHAHYWREPAQRTVQLGEHDRPLSPGRLARLMDGAGVSRLLQITRSFDADDAYSIAGAVRYPDRFRVLMRGGRQLWDGRAPGYDPRPHPSVVGIRIFSHPVDEGLFGRHGETFWRAVEDSGIPVSIYAPGYASPIGELAMRYPGIRFVIDHAGLFVFHWVPLSERMGGWDQVLGLAGIGNLFVKASGLPEVTGEAFPYPRAQEIFRELCRRFGADHVMWGSNYPPARKAGAYRRHVEFARQAVSVLVRSEQKAVLAGTAARVFDLRFTAA